jgi:hypothetical protein
VWRQTTDHTGAVTLDLSTQVAGKSNVVIRFRYYDARFDWYWQIDDVMLTGVADAPPTPTPAPPAARASVVTLTNNVLVSHTVGITVGAGSTATLEATLWGTGTWTNEADWGGAGVIVTGMAENNVWGAPAFLAPGDGDYHLDPESAAIDRGVGAGVTEDIDGDPRRGDPDLGADEFVWKVFLPLVARDQTGFPSNR